MTIAELKEIIKEYPDDQFVHMRIWFIGNDIYNPKGTYAINVTVMKAQQGVDGGLLLTGNMKV